MSPVRIVPIVMRCSSIQPDYSQIGPANVSVYSSPEPESVLVETPQGLWIILGGPEKGRRNVQKNGFRRKIVTIRHKTGAQKPQLLRERND